MRRGVARGDRLQAARVDKASTRVEDVPRRVCHTLRNPVVKILPELPILQLTLQLALCRLERLVARKHLVVATKLRVLHRNAVRKIALLYAILQFTLQLRLSLLEALVAREHFVIAPKLSLLHPLPRPNFLTLQHCLQFTLQLGFPLLEPLLARKLFKLAGNVAVLHCDAHLALQLGLALLEALLACKHLVCLRCFVALQLQTNVTLQLGLAGLRAKLRLKSCHLRGILSSSNFTLRLDTRPIYINLLPLEVKPTQPKHLPQPLLYIELASLLCLLLRGKCILSSDIAGKFLFTQRHVTRELFIILRGLRSLNRLLASLFKLPLPELCATQLLLKLRGLRHTIRFKLLEILRPSQFSQPLPKLHQLGTVCSLCLGGALEELGVDVSQGTRLRPAKATQA